MWPIDYTARMSMFDGIDVNVVNVRRIVALIANQMFPISPLPDPSLAFRHSARTASFQMRLLSRKRGFDQPPTQRIVAVVLPQRPHSVQMIRQDDDGIDHEGMPRMHGAKCGSEQVNLIFQES